MKSEKYECPVCFREVALTRKGRLRQHLSKERMDLGRYFEYLYEESKWCSGKGMYPYMAVLAKFPGSHGEIHEVREGKDGVIYCTCWAWRKSTSKPKDCTHLKQIREALITEDTSIFTKMLEVSEYERNLGR